MEKSGSIHANPTAAPTSVNRFGLLRFINRQNDDWTDFCITGARRRPSDWTFPQTGRWATPYLEMTWKNAGRQAGPQRRQGHDAKHEFDANSVPVGKNVFGSHGQVILSEGPRGGFSC